MYLLIDFSVAEVMASKSILSPHNVTTCVNVQSCFAAHMREGSLRGSLTFTLVNS